MEDKTDFRAACFCHKHVVDVGYVCSVCLSSLAHSIALSTYLCLLSLSKSFANLFLSAQLTGELIRPISSILTTCNNPIARYSTNFPMKTLQRLFKGGDREKINDSRTSSSCVLLTSAEFGDRFEWKYRKEEFSAPNPSGHRCKLDQTGTATKVVRGLGANCRCVRNGISARKRSS